MDLNGIILSALMIYGAPMILIVACIKEIREEKKVKKNNEKR